MDETELVPGPSAGQYDLWRQLLNVGAIAIPIVVGTVLTFVGVAGQTIAGIMVTLFVALFIVTMVLGSRVTRTMRREMEAGYSTLYDVADFELRHARSRELLRAASVKPETPGKRSLVAGMFQVKPGTVLAKRIDEDKN